MTTRIKEMRPTPRKFLQLAGMTDSELVEETIKDSPEAFQVLADRYTALVKSIAAKYLDRDSMGIEDVVQETFLKALVRIGDLRDKSRFRSWLCTIARNLALDTACQREPVLSWEIETDDGGPIRWEVPDERANPDELVSQAEVSALMKDVLKDIPTMYLEPISLRFEKGMEYDEIATVLRKPLGTVKSLIHRGKVLVKKELSRRTWGLEGAHAMAIRA
jgi:RNA polymerase sigma-70 factor, ECF subfamily